MVNETQEGIGQLRACVEFAWGDAHDAEGDGDGRQTRAATMNSKPGRGWCSVTSRAGGVLLRKLPRESWPTSDEPVALLSQTAASAPEEREAEGAQEDNPMAYRGHDASMLSGPAAPLAAAATPRSQRKTANALLMLRRVVRERRERRGAQLKLAAEEAQAVAAREPNPFRLTIEDEMTTPAKGGASASAAPGDSQVAATASAAAERGAEHGNDGASPQHEDAASVRGRIMELQAARQSALARQDMDAVRSLQAQIEAVRAEEEVAALRQRVAGLRAAQLDAARASEFDEAHGFKVQVEAASAELAALEAALPSAALTHIIALRASTVEARAQGATEQGLLRDRIAGLRQAQRQAVEREDFDEAHRLKLQLEETSAQLAASVSEGGHGSDPEEGVHGPTVGGQEDNPMAYRGHDASMLSSAGTQ